MRNLLAGWQLENQDSWKSVLKAFIVQSDANADNGIAWESHAVEMFYPLSSTGVVRGHRQLSSHD
jgi:hypothetical protein